MNKKKLQKIGWIVGILVLLSVILLGSIKLFRVKKARESGILLAFDDYAEQNWRDHFDFFEKHNVHVTFFVCLDEPTAFCEEALKRGHDIGFHTSGHVDVTELTEEELQRRVIDPIETFRQGGIELTSFAYPYGNHNDELDQKLLEHFKVVRGAYLYEVHGKADLFHGYIDAFPIDNYYLADDKQYQQKIDAILKELSENVGAVTCLYSHAIDGGDWCITEAHLEYLFQRAEELGLRFYTFRELQKD